MEEVGRLLHEAGAGIGSAEGLDNLGERALEAGELLLAEECGPAEPVAQWIRDAARLRCGEARRGE